MTLTTNSEAAIHRQERQTGTFFEGKMQLLGTFFEGKMFQGAQERSILCTVAAVRRSKECRELSCAVLSTGKRAGTVSRSLSMAHAKRARPG
jgi:hypothetical protein